MSDERKESVKVNSSEYARLAVGSGIDRKALDPVALDLRGLSSVADFFVILTGTSNRHVQAVAENIMEAFKGVGSPLLGSEGLSEGKWVLLDYGDVVVHIFLEPVREYYDIERLWIDADHLDLDSSADDKEG